VTMAPVKCGGLPPLFVAETGPAHISTAFGAGFVGA